MEVDQAQKYPPISLLSSDLLSCASRRKKKKNRRNPSKTPCFFFSTPKGCNRGDKCPFLHAALSESMEMETREPEAAPPVVSEEDDIAEQFAKMMVPSKLSFGRRGAGRTHKFGSL